MSATEEAPSRPRRMEPPVGESSQPFWDATREKKFLLQWCTRCDAPIFYPRAVCPQCLGSSFEWKEASGRGEIYAASVQEKPGNPLMADRVPYVVALVQLEEGPRVMTNIINVDDPYAATVGLPVHLTWEPLSDGRHLPQFEPERG